MELNIKEIPVQKNRDPVYELIDNAKDILYSPDCIRAVVVFTLSYYSVLNMAFVTNQWLDPYVDPSFAIGSLILTLCIAVLSMVKTFPLITLTWERLKKGYPSLLTRCMNRLIVLFCVYISMGYLFMFFSLFGALIPKLLFYGVSILLLDGIGQITLAKREVSAHDVEYERLRREDYE